MKFKVNIEQELDSQKKQSQDGNKIVDSAKLLLAGDHAEEIDLLKKMGLGHQIVKAEEHRGINIEREKIENQYEGKVFTEDEIKSICLDYNLRFLPTQRFKGSVDLELGVKIRNFFKKHNLNPNQGGLDTDSFYIMAPTKAFNLDDRPKPSKTDPVLFYRPSRRDDKYLLVHKWGNEFTVMRLIGGMMRRNSGVHLTFMFGFFVCLFNIALASYGNYSPLTDIVCSLFYGFIAQIIYVMTVTGGGDDKDKFDRKFSDECWNSIYK